MDSKQIRRLLDDVRSGSIQIDEAMSKLKGLPYEDLGFAKIDTHRDLRTGFPEVVFCEGKSPEHLTAVAGAIAARGGLLMATRADQAAVDAIRQAVPDAVYHEQARIVETGPRREKSGGGSILVVSAGTSDIPVAEEAVVTAEIMGNDVVRLYDVGVAGLHRVLDRREELDEASVIIVVAGMEGALASIVGGLTDKPVVAVPTSIGYGASFEGLSALLTMLNGCAPGVAVVNIDNGFGAGYFAASVNRVRMGA
ncbi:nickel pincer cofactor biosynthesis protein LarB [bacterium]|nr:nickel pincer cofactor biosynthesis protein LarB [bacterium]